MFNLTPTELARLSADGEVRVVRKMEPQPDFGEYESTSDKQKHFVLNQTAYVRMNSPFPPAGTRKVIDGIGCVWGESGCKQVRDLDDEMYVEERWFCPNGPLCNNAQPARDWGGNVIEPAFMNCSCGDHSYMELFIAGRNRDYGETVNETDYYWVGHVRKDERA